MKTEAKLENMHYDFARKGTKFEFFCYGDITEGLQEFLGLETNVELYKDKRSLNANGYLWTLLGQLQEKLRIPKEELYRNYIYTCGAYDVYCMQDCAVDTFKKSWSSNGLGWVTEEIKSKIPGCTNIMAYRGTSDYSKEEMAVILDQVVQDCIAQGIPVKREEELKGLLEKWK